MKIRINKPLDREKVAVELAEARLLGPAPTSFLRSSVSQEVLASMAKIQHELLVELYLAHYSNKQLRALSEFYSTRVGISIAETDSVIEEEFRREFHNRLNLFMEGMEASPVQERTSPDGPIASWSRRSSNDQQ